MFSRLKAICREPVLSVPVLVLESDDWGPGPAFHAERLERLRRMLGSFEDAVGRYPVMTLGVVLAIPHSRAVHPNAAGVPRRLLSDEEFRGIRCAMLRGKTQGVFDLHLHGMEHCWFPALFRAGQTDGAVRRWLDSGDCPLWEDLPPALQTRWANGSTLPTRPLAEDAIGFAVAEETEAFHKIFGFQAQVAVPPTFIWNDAVERAWAKAGIQVIVTPGRRNELRDAQGKPSGSGMAIDNGQRSPFGPAYLVRDVYFEPARGHSWKRVLRALEVYRRLGRPVLVEMHRANFIGAAPKAEKAFRELECLLRAVKKRIPHIRYLTTLELATRIVFQDPDLVERRIGPRIPVILRRIWHERRLRLAACLSGLVVPGLLLYWISEGWNACRKHHRRSARPRDAQELRRGACRCKP